MGIPVSYKISNGCIRALLPFCYEAELVSGYRFGSKQKGMGRKHSCRLGDCIIQRIR